MTQRRSASFFKILLDPTAPHLPLPPDFVNTHLENKIPKNPVIRSSKGGYVWRLKIKKIGESLCFSNGWDTLVQDINLGFGDFLVFMFDFKSCFKLVVYSPNGCEKDFPQKTNNLLHDVHDDDVHVNVKDNDDDDVVVGDDDDVMEEEDVDDDDDGKEDEDEFEDEDEDEDEDEEGYEEVKDEDEDDGDDDGDGDGGIDGHDGDPFFMLVISKTHKNMLRIPTNFAELAEIEEGTLTMANLDGKEWQLGVHLEKSNQSERYYISTGWRDFQQGNDLCEGDECVFKFIRSEDKLLLARVTKNKRPVNEGSKRKRDRPVRNSSESPATKVKKRKRGLAAAHRTREQPARNSGKSPATKVEKRKKGQAAAREEHDGGSVQVVKTPRGRPARRK